MVFSDDIGMAAAFSAGGVKARIDDHLDAGCDVVLVSHSETVSYTHLDVYKRQGKDEAAACGPEGCSID